MEVSFGSGLLSAILILCTGSAQHFGSTLKASLGPPSICVSSSHMNLTHVGPTVGRLWKGKKGASSCPHHANASAAAKVMQRRSRNQQPIRLATLRIIVAGYGNLNKVDLVAATILGSRSSSPARSPVYYSS